MNVDELKCPALRPDFAVWFTQAAGTFPRPNRVENHAKIESHSSKTFPSLELAFPM